MKASSISPANIAFIKYWGQKDQKSFLPYNNSISMNLSNCISKTTVEFSNELKEDSIEIGFENKTFSKLSPTESGKNGFLFGQIENIRKLAGIAQKVRVKSVNNFPSDAGIAASASGFSALTVALCKAAGLNEIIADKRALSSLVRQAGSVSAMRSIFDGFTESCVTENECYTQQIADEKHWDLVDIIAITTLDKKSTSSTDGHSGAETSPYFAVRLQEISERLASCRKAILQKDFTKLGECMEADTISMHAVMMTSKPPIFYWNEGTMQVLNAIFKWRNEGLQVYFSIDAGANVHVICLSKDAQEIEASLLNLDKVLRTIINVPAMGTKITEEHLF